MPRHAMTREQALKALELHADASFQEIKQAYRDLGGWVNRCVNVSGGILPLLG